MKYWKRYLNEVQSNNRGGIAAPITFIEKLCDDFEIMNANDFRINIPLKSTYLIKDKEAKLGNRTTYARVVIRRMLHEV